MSAWTTRTFKIPSRTTSSPSATTQLAFLILVSLSLAANAVLLPAGHLAFSQPLPTQSPVPPIATCLPKPTGGPTSPPGLYPITYIENVWFDQTTYPHQCPTSIWNLWIRIGNRGITLSRPMRLRAAGTCVGAPREVDIPAIGAQEAVAVVVPGPMKILACDVTLMLDPMCDDDEHIDRYWSGSPGHVDPPIICTTPPLWTPTRAATATPRSTDTPTPPPTATATLRPTATPKAWQRGIYLPHLRDTSPGASSPGRAHPEAVDANDSVARVPVHSHSTSQCARTSPLTAAIPVGNWQAQNLAQASSLNTPIGQYGGQIAAMLPLAATRAGQRVLIGHGPRLALIEVTDPSSPRPVGHGPALKGLVTDIAQDESKLFVAAGGALHLLDSATPLGAPREIFSAELAMTKVKVYHGIAYPIHEGAPPTPNGGYGIWRYAVSVVDVRDPAFPKQISANLLVNGEYAVDELVQAGRLYVSIVDNPNAELEEWVGHLVVFDLTDPTSPRRIAKLDGAQWGALAAPSGNRTDAHIYGVAKGLIGLDLTDPTRPRDLLRRDSEWYVRSVPWWSHLIVMEDGRAYVAAGNGFGGGVITAISGAARLTSDFYANVDGSPTSFVTAGRRLLVAEPGGRLTVLDPLAGKFATLTSRLDLIGTVQTVALDVARPGTLFATLFQGGLGVLDVSDPSRLSALGFAYDGGYHDGPLDVSGGHTAIVFNGGAGDALRNVFDLFGIADSAAPEAIGYVDPHQHRSNAMARRGEIAFVTSNKDDILRTDANIQAWDIEDQKRPGLVDLLAIHGEIGGLAVDGETLVVARYEGFDTSFTQKPRPFRVDLIDVRDSTAMTLIRTLDFGAEPGFDYDLPIVSAHGRVAYVVAPVGAYPQTVRHTLYVVDQDQPNGKAIATLPLPAKPSAMLWADGYLFLTRESKSVAGDGTTVIDVREPSQPRVVGEIPDAFGQGNRVAVHRGLVYASSGKLGIQVYQPDLPWDFEAAPATYTPAPTRVRPTPTPTASPTPTFKVYLPSLHASEQTPYRLPQKASAPHGITPAIRR